MEGMSVWMDGWTYGDDDEDDNDSDEDLFMHRRPLMHLVHAVIHPFV